MLCVSYRCRDWPPLVNSKFGKRWVWSRAHQPLLHDWIDISTWIPSVYLLDDVFHRWILNTTWYSRVKKCALPKIGKTGRISDFQFSEKYHSRVCFTASIVKLAQFPREVGVHRWYFGDTVVLAPDAGGPRAPPRRESRPIRCDAGARKNEHATYTRQHGTRG